MSGGIFFRERNLETHFFTRTRKRISTGFWMLRFLLLLFLLLRFLSFIFITSSLVLSGYLIRRNKSFIFYDRLIERFR